MNTNRQRKISRRRPCGTVRLADALEQMLQTEGFGRHIGRGVQRAVVGCAAFANPCGQLRFELYIQRLLGYGELRGTHIYKVCGGAEVGFVVLLHIGGCFAKAHYFVYREVIGRLQRVISGCRFVVFVGENAAKVSRYNQAKFAAVTRSCVAVRESVYVICARGIVIFLERALLARRV